MSDVDPNAPDSDDEAILAALTGSGADPAEIPDEPDPLTVSDDEGQYADYGGVVNSLKNLLSLKYQLLVMYMNYGDVLQHVARDGIYEHFQEHIKEERQHVYEISKRLSALGEVVEVSFTPFPPVSDLRGALLELLKAEQTAQRGWRTLRSYAGNNLALDSFCQDGAWKDGQHADDMRRYLRSEA